MYGYDVLWLPIIKVIILYSIYKYTTYNIYFNIKHASASTQKLNSHSRMFLLFTDGNLGDDSEEEGTVMLNLDSVAEEKPVR